MTCPRCGQPNLAHAKFCLECATPLARPRCARCGADAPGDARFCPQCGYVLDTPDEIGARVPAAARALVAPEAELRRLTVMFCDLVGSTELSGRVDPEELRQIVRRYQAACAEVIRRFEGHIAQYLGDGLLVYFGYPTAHEDDAQRAVAAGLGIVEAVGPLGLGVRIGIHTGPVVIGEVGDAARPERLALGETPNLAARIESAAEPNTVMISGATYRLVRDGFTCRDLGTRAFKGIETPVAVHRVLAGAPVRSRPDAARTRSLTALVGRDQEVGLLLDRWTRARDGAGQVVLVSGEPGIGKSRLVQAVRGRLAGDAHTRLECRCSPYHQASAFYPLIELLQRMFGLATEDTDEQRLAKLEDGLAPLAASWPDAVPLYAALLSVPTSPRYPSLAMTPQRQKEKTLEVVLGVLLAMAAREPVVFIVEDVHWADPSTLELLGVVVEQTPTARLLVVLTFRPEFRSPWPARPHALHVTLDRLSKGQTELLVTHVAGGKRLPSEVARELVTKTDGIPLFVEELTKTLLESGLVRDTPDGWQLDRPLESLSIPSTLHDSLAARLDRLGESRSVAQLGATLGREFRYDLLAAVSDVDEATLRSGLARLIDAELLYQRGLGPQATYVFKHALIQEAAYTALLRSTRQERHEHIARVLERDFPEVRDTQPETLAHHHTQAGHAAVAITWWHRAAQAAMQRWANVEAIAHLGKALDLLPALPEERERQRLELALRMTLATALTVSRGWGDADVEAALQRARVLATEVGDTAEVLHKLWSFYQVRGDMRVAIEEARGSLDVARAAGDRHALMDAHCAMGATSLVRAEFAAAGEHLACALPLYDAALDAGDALRRGVDTAVACLTYTGFLRWITGLPDQAGAAVRETSPIAERLAHPFVTAFSLFGLGYVTFLRRESDALGFAQRLMTLCREQRIDFWIPYAGGVLGRLLSDIGRGAEGLAEAEGGLAIGGAMGTGFFRPYIIGLTAEIQAGLGRLPEALETIDRAIALADDRLERAFEPELHRIRGELLLLRPDADVVEAETVFRRSIDIARSQGAWSWQLRAAMSLARLLEQHGRVEEARGSLGEIYASFTEGFDTGDLREAKALLDRL